MSHNDNLLHSLTSAAVTKWQDPVTGQHPESPEGNLHPNTHMHPHTDAFMLSVVRANSRMLTHRSLTSHGHVTCYYTRLSQTCAHSRSNADEQEETLHLFFFFLVSQFCFHEHLVRSAGRSCVIALSGKFREELWIGFLGKHQSKHLSVCAGLLDRIDLSSQGGSHPGGEGTAGEQCQPGASRHGENREEQWHYSWRKERDLKSVSEVPVSKNAFNSYILVIFS